MAISNDVTKAAQSMGLSPDEVQSKLDSGNYSLGYNPGDGGAESGVTTPESWSLQPTNPTVLWADKLGMTMDQVNKLNSTPEGQAQWNSMVTQAEDKQAHADDGPLGIDKGIWDSAALFTAWLTAGTSLGGEMTAGGTSAESLSGADAAGGLMPEYGTTTAYQAGMTPRAATAATSIAAAGGSNLTASGTAAAGGEDEALFQAGFKGTAMPAPVAEADPTFGGALAKTAAGVYDATTANGILQWAEAHPELASSMLTAAGLTVAGAAKGAADYATMLKKNELDTQALLEIAKQKPYLYQQFVQASGAGGIGVNIPIKAPNRARTLNTTSGQPVFAPGGGLIGSRLGG